MHPSFRAFLPLVLLAMVACSKPATDAAPAAVAPSDSDGVAPAARNSAATAPADSGFELTMDEVDAYYATIGKISERAMQEGKAGDEDDDPTAMNGSESVEQYIARIEADPKAREMVTSAGMSVSAYAHTNEALLAGMMAAGALQSGALKKIPDGVNPQYVEFVQQHKAELDAKMAALQKQVGG